MSTRARTSARLVLAAAVVIALSSTAVGEATDGRVVTEIYTANMPGSCGIVPHVLGGASACFDIFAGERILSIDINDDSDPITNADPTGTLFGGVPFIGIFTGDAHGQIRFCGDTSEIWIPKGATGIVLEFWSGNCADDGFTTKIGLVTRGELRVEFTS